MEPQQVGPTCTVAAVDDRGQQAVQNSATAPLSCIALFMLLNVLNKRYLWHRHLAFRTAAFRMLRNASAAPVRHGRSLDPVTGSKLGDLVSFCKDDGENNVDLNFLREPSTFDSHFAIHRHNVAFHTGTHLQQSFAAVEKHQIVAWRLLGI